MTQLSAKRQHVKRIEQAVSDGQCIYPGCCKSLKTRGLCQRHYTEFKRKYDSQDDDAARLHFEQAAISEGIVLPSGKQRSMTKSSLYNRIA